MKAIVPQSKNVAPPGMRRFGLMTALLGVTLMLSKETYQIVVAGIALSDFALIFIGVILALVGYALYKGGWYGMKGLGVVIAVAAILAFSGFWLLVATPSMTSGGGQPGAVQLGMNIVPSIDTTASLPASPYTACTSLSLISQNGAKTAAGVVWGAISGGIGAVYNPGAGNAGTFIEQQGAQTAVTGGGGKMSQQCFQMKFTLSYTNVPTASGGGAIGLPIYVNMNSITMASSGLDTSPLNLAYSNGTLVNVPVFPSSVGLSDFPVLLKDGAGNWNPLCPNFRATNFQTNTAILNSCAGFDANLARSTGQITFTIDVIVNLAGPFGYTTTSGSGDSPIGSTMTFTFSIGLPSSLSNAQINNAYTPTMAQYSLVLTRTAS